MKITRSWLTKNRACEEGGDWFKESGLTDHAEITLALLKDKRYLWANWMLVRLMEHKDKVRYAIYAAKVVLPIYEKKYPDNKAPRKAIETAEKWLKGEVTIEEVRAAADAAYAAYAAADAAADVAYAAYAAADAAYAAYAADAAADAAYAAADAAVSHKFRTSQINYGLKLIAEAK